MVTDFTVNALVPRAFFRAFIFVGYVYPKKILPGNIMGLILKKKMATISYFYIFFLIFLQTLTLSVLKTQISGETKYIIIIKGFSRKVFLKNGFLCLCTGLAG